jgi:hypothetical protein
MIDNPDRSWYNNNVVNKCGLAAANRLDTEREFVFLIGLG